jgi:hypothetical protein
MTGAVGKQRIEVNFAINILFRETRYTGFSFKITEGSDVIRTRTTGGSIGSAGQW